MFVTIEGIEGSGKSTLLSALSERLQGQGHDVVTAREPGGTLVGDAVREIFLHAKDLHISPLSEALLINASRAALVANVIRPSLERGAIVLCDRYTDSTLAYQGYGRGLDLSILHAMCDAATGGLQPDLTIVLDVPVDVSRSRTTERGNLDRMDDQSVEFYERARQGFRELAAHSDRMHVLDAMQAPQSLVQTSLGMIQHDI